MDEHRLKELLSYWFMHGTHLDPDTGREVKAQISANWGADPWCALYHDAYVFWWEEGDLRYRRCYSLDHK